jgi:outer membrane lipoprotein SlyB
VESVREVVEQKNPSGAGLIVGGLVGGGLGSLVGAGTGRTVATVVGALGGAYAGNRIEGSQAQVVYQIGVKYDDGSWATIRQAAPTGLRIGDRVRVTDQGVELLR